MLLQLELFFHDGMEVCAYKKSSQILFVPCYRNIKIYNLEREGFEIMAPVGSYESLMAAIQGGADSIYFGIEGLNMRFALFQ